MKREGAVWGRSAQLWGHRRQDALTMSTMTWWPLLLTLVALCTGDWMGDRGRALGKHTSLLPPLLPEAHSHLCVSPFQDPEPRLC